MANFENYPVQALDACTVSTWSFYNTWLVVVTTEVGFGAFEVDISYARPTRTWHRVRKGLAVGEVFEFLALVASLRFEQLPVQERAIEGFLQRKGGEEGGSTHAEAPAPYVKRLGDVGGRSRTPVPHLSAGPVAREKHITTVRPY